MWQLLNPMGRNWSCSNYRPGEAEYFYAYFRFEQGNLTEEQLVRAEQLAKSGKSRSTKSDHETFAQAQTLREHTGRSLGA